MSGNDWVSAGAGTRHLPAEIAAIVGRKRELTQLREILVETRLLTLTGVGGVGKSRLALGVATGHQRHYGGGAWLVELAAVRDPRLVGSAVARSLGVHKRSREPLEAGIARFLDGAPALLLLDNCEHVLCAAAELAHSLLEHCAELRVLATSRQPLGLEGEATFAVPPLAVPKGELEITSPRQALAFGAIEMFAARASAAEPEFAVTDENVQDVIEICRRLEGIPLGLELAAVRVRTLSLSDLRDRLDDQLTLPNLNARSAFARHQTLAATLDWSHDLLSEKEQLLLRRLSVFSGGFTAEGAERVCADESLPRGDIVETLTGLVEKSLVVVERDRASVRYRLLEPVRLYGLGHLRATGDDQRFQRSHLRWCLEWTAALELWHLGPGPGEAKLVNDESANLFAALEFSLAEPDGIEAGLALIDQTARIWLISSWERELAHYSEAFLRTLRGKPQIRARVLYANGRVRWRLGDHDSARDRFHECLALAGRRNGYDLERGLARIGLGFAAVWAGENSEAAAHLAQAIELIDPSVAAAMHVEATLWLACTFVQDEKRHPEARALVEEALITNEAAFDQSNRGLAHWLLGEIDLREGRCAGAETHFELALSLRYGIGHRVGVAYGLQGLAFVAGATSRHTRAAQLMGAADAIAEGLGHALAQLPGTDRASWERAVRSNLGDRRFLEAYGAGHARHFSDALGLGLGDQATLSQVPVRNGDVLTRREHEIARLIATGATNRKIAGKLAISDQTVKFHVHNILAKLSFETRTEIAAWQTRQPT